MIRADQKLSQEEKRKRQELHNKAMRKKRRKFRKTIKAKGFATTMSNHGGGSAKVQRVFRKLRAWTGFPVERAKENWKSMTHLQRGQVRRNMVKKITEVMQAKLDKQNKK